MKNNIFLLSPRLVSFLKNIKHPFIDALLEYSENEVDIKSELYQFSYIDISDTSINQLTYCPPNRRSDTITEEDKWYTYRLSINFGRLLKAFLIANKIKHSDVHIDYLVNHFKALHFKEQYSFEMMTGQDIIKYYSSNTHVSLSEQYPIEENSLSRSCMNNASQEKLNLYLHPNIQMLCLIDKKTKKLIGRAIVWNKVQILETKEEVVFMDRIYTISNIFESLFKSYAKDKGWVMKSTQASKLFIKDNKLETLSLVFRINNDVKLAPYLDTMHYIGYDEDGILLCNNIYNARYIANTTGIIKSVNKNINYKSYLSFWGKRNMDDCISLIRYDNGFLWIEDNGYVILIKDNNEYYNIKANIIRNNKKEIKNITLFFSNTHVKIKSVHGEAIQHYIDDINEFVKDVKLA